MSEEDGGDTPDDSQGSSISVSIATKSGPVLRDLDLIKTFPNVRVSWSINTLDEAFRREMDVAVSIERRLEAEGLPYVRNDDSVHSKHGEPPVVVNYFFHEEIISSARKE